MTMPRIEAGSSFTAWQQQLVYEAKETKAFSIEESMKLVVHLKLALQSIEDSQMGTQAPLNTKLLHCMSAVDVHCETYVTFV